MNLIQWCRDNPGSNFLPFAVIGHGPKLYTWTCQGTKPTIVGQNDIGNIDALDYSIGPWVEVRR